MAPPAGPIRVVHVDDDEAFGTVVARQLERTDHDLHVEVISDPDRALARVRGDEGPDVDCIVSDLDMPGASGLDLLAALRERRPDVPFIIFTGTGSEAAASEAISAGVTDYLRKSGDAEQFAILANRIVNAVAGYRARRERERAFEVLDDAVHGIVGADGREAVFDVLVRTGREVLGLTAVGVWAYDEDARELVPVVYPDDPTLPTDPPTFGEGEGLAWDVFVAGETGVFDDVSAESGRYNPETAIGSEVIAAIGDHGVLQLGAREARAFDEIDRRLVDILARTAAGALDRIEYETTLERLHGATHALLSAETPDAVARQTLTTAQEILGHEYAVVRLLDEEAELLQPVVATDSVLADTERRPAYRPGEGSAGTAFARGEATIFDTQRLDDDVERRGIETTLCVPIGDRGVLTVAHAEPEAFDDADVRLAEMLAANAETALQRIARQADLERQNERLEQFASVVSHDLRNPLNVVAARLDTIDVEERHRRPMERSMERAFAIIDDVLTLARQGQVVGDPGPAALRDVATAAWESVETRDASLAVEDDARIVADGERLQQFLENLFRNAVEHGSTDVSVRVGPIEGGFFVEDDGPGIPEDERERVFESGYTTAGDGTGFGLAIVERIAEAHGWDVALASGQDGGARFEVTGVESGGGAP